MANDAWTRDYYGLHDVCFTYGVNLPGGAPGVPLSDVDWKPLLPPVVLDLWPRGQGAGTGFTTIGTWEARDRDVEVNGKKLSWRKNVKYEAMINLPSRVPGARLELTMSGMKDAVDRYAAAGWLVRDALAVSRDPVTYRDYIRGSMAEFTIAKDQNVVLKSGWFSDRTAAYLAAGRPAVVEDTGFGAYLPVGKGLFPFTDADGAVAGIEAVLADPVAAGNAARAIDAALSTATRCYTDFCGVLAGEAPGPPPVSLTGCSGGGPRPPPRSVLLLRSFPPLRLPPVRDRCPPCGTETTARCAEAGALGGRRTRPLWNPGRMRRLHVRAQGMPLPQSRHGSSLSA